MDKGIDSFLEVFSSDPGRVRLDSRQVVPGDAFIAVKGALHDGHTFIEEAVRNGALTVLCEYIPAEVIGSDVKFAIVPDTEQAVGKIAKKVYGDPSSKMKLYGITGTNGKTTTAFLMHQILEAAGFSCGLVSTVYNIVAGDARCRSTMTTPGAMELNRLLFKMSQSGKDTAVIEISSHALAQRRTAGLGIDRAVFTNITPEHIDYHKSMDAYLAAKSEIFNILKPDGIGVINADDPLVANALKLSGMHSKMTFGIDRTADVWAENIRLSSSGAEFEIKAKSYGEVHVTTCLIGKHNIYNVLGAACALLSSGIDIKVIGRAIEKFSPVPGRFEKIDHSGGFDVFVDYAHTPDALENALKSLRTFAKKRIICVFGCGGDRDRSKRPMMGKIAGNFADYVILTSDNPRSERPDEILRQIEKGVIGKCNYSIIESRSDAIFAAVEMAEAGDTIIIAGKGHEDYQITGEGAVHFDDREAVGQALRQIGY